MKTQQKLFLALWALVLAGILLFELGVLPREVFSLDAQSAYGVDMVCVLCTIIGGVVVFKMPVRWHALVLGFVVVLNLLAYYLAAGAHSPKYCFLIAFLLSIVAWPRKKSEE